MKWTVFFNKKLIYLLPILFLIACNKKEAKFPFKLPLKKPAQQLSAAMERNYDAYPAPRPEKNELYSLFKYTELKGFDYNGRNGTISRRDPSKVIFTNGKYYVWYTYRNTVLPPVGPKKANDTLASRDWDLAEIWYATSKDGFTWEEQGVAIARPEKPKVGWRSVSTADILIWKGKYYLYYQGFLEVSGRQGDNCPVAVSYADSPDGPWKATHQIVIPNGGEGEWDQNSIHDPYPLVYKDKIYLYYKSDFDRNPKLIRMQGLATATHPLGPFEKHALNPVINSGHETTLFPFEKGIAAFVIKDGNEHFTIQYAEDGVNFEIASITSLMPIAAGPYVPDAFTNTTDGRGITWGLSHVTFAGPNNEDCSVLLRFDCDLSKDTNDPEMKYHSYDGSYSPEFLYRFGLSEKQIKRIKSN